MRASLSLRPPISNKGCGHLSPTQCLGTFARQGSDLVPKGQIKGTPHMQAKAWSPNETCTCLTGTLKLTNV